ncbi:adenosylcobinamide-GDP ribazoletransferase [Alicyclobacillus dauci]|uniref:Adenosylcobinamide-GDP ribazoletransferase n=1 Tax=Alicyclobacillus dauci TaxID=1475485 RepID=A0ABY6Z8Y0_9BACL|nr:adenosylcobinamide-GDP ribazoletransferase [Alicyclobacillus dauci]WAH38714.1 adenosylcobinamide-GDP ribazoletransferase [Alicyclobacillus dauci]
MLINMIKGKKDVRTPMRGIWRAFVLSWQFFTIIPAPHIASPSEREMRRSAYFLPVIGLILGGILVGSRDLFSYVVPVGAATFLAITLYILCTGALHIDGLMDTADAIGSRKPRDEALSIMKDSRVGAMGAIAAVLLVAGKWIAIASLGSSTYPLIFVPMFSRLAMLWSMMLVPAAKPSGLGAMFALRVRPLYVVAVSAFCLALTLLFVPFFSVIVLFVVFFAPVFAFSYAMAHRFGGMTGDTYGALAELTEWVLYFVALGLMTHPVFP